jgi:hypothetical protein
MSDEETRANEEMKIENKVRTQLCKNIGQRKKSNMNKYCFKHVINKERVKNQNGSCFRLLAIFLSQIWTFLVFSDALSSFNSEEDLMNSFRRRQENQLSSFKSIKSLKISH